MKHIIKHLKDNSGDGYIWFIVIIIVFLIMFGAIFNLLETNIAMRNLRTEIDQAAEDVYADIREVAYGNLTAGATDNTFTAYTANQIAELYAQKLNANISWEGGHPVLTRDGKSGRQFAISNLSYMYIDRVKEHGSSRYSLGDLNKDDYVNDADLQLLMAYLEDTTIPITVHDYDVNRDGEVSILDKPVLEALIRYYAQFNGSVKSETSSALLLITMDVSVPIKYGTFDFGESTDSYFYVTTLTVKQS